MSADACVRSTGNNALAYSADHFSRAAAWECVVRVSKRQGVVGNPWRKDHVYCGDGTPLLWRWRWVTEVYQ